MCITERLEVDVDEEPPVWLGISLFSRFTCRALNKIFAESRRPPDDLFCDSP